MNQNIRGLRCSLNYFLVADFLKYLSKKAWEFHIPWCVLDGNIKIVDHKATTKDLEALNKHRIWEIEMQCYPRDSVKTSISNYQDFYVSCCACYLLYFDCGYLELYIKQPNDFEQFWDFLMSLGAEDLVVVTDINDTRTQFTV